MKQTPENTSLGKWKEDERIKLLDNIVLLLDNGFSLNEGLIALPDIWTKKRVELRGMNALMINNVHFEVILAKVGFSLTTTTQISMAIEQGTLTECLKQLTRVLVLKREQMKRVKQEMAYPFVIVTMMSFLMLFMRFFMGNYLPEEPTSLLKQAGIGALLLIVVGVIFAFGYTVRALKHQSYRELQVISGWPIIGKLVLLYAKYLVLFNLNILLTNGFSLQDICVFTAKQEAGSLQQVLGKSVQQRLLAGEKLQEIIANEPFLTNELLFAVNTGSERSEVAKQVKVLELIEYQELADGLQKISLKLQPISFMIIGVGILTMYLKLLLPVYSMMQGL